MWLATLVEFLPPVTRAVAPSFHSMPIVPPPCIQDKVQNQGSGPPTDAKSQDVVLSDASSRSLIYKAQIASCVQNYSVTRALAPTNCTFPTEAKTKDKVLLASPNAAKVVTFITHIASCIQSSMLCITRLLASLLMQRHSLGHSIEIDS